jgi:putative FmdB family regulatory protein
MPIYEYDCPKCGRFDVLQKMSSRPLTRHDACGSRVTKAVSAGAFTFKSSASLGSAPACEKASPACAGCPSAKA